ncbi:MAG: hypothetical protein ACRD2T_03990 [Thermoanaerobaculia bacterium]
MPHLLICVANDGAEDLQVLKIYRRIPDSSAEAKGFVRVVDDSGEDYVYPQANFLSLPLPESLAQQLEELAAERAST